MIWLEFAAAAALVVLAAVRLTTYGDAIAVRTRLGGMFIGTLLLAGATSLPELLTTINALGQQVPNLAAGNLFGSNMFNMLLLALLDLFKQDARILRLVAARHALSAGLAMLLIAMAVFFILADFDVAIGWVGLGSWLMMATYLGGLWLLRGDDPTPAPSPTQAALAGVPGLRHATVGFAAATVVLVVITPWLVRSSVRLAELTGLGAGFFGTLFLGAVTSLPEVVVLVAAARVGAYDLAVGNLFGSNIFNMFALALTDVFYLPGRFLEEIAPAFALAGMAGLILTGIGQLGNLARVRRRFGLVELEALLILLVYAGGMWLLHLRGLG